MHTIDGIDSKKQSVEIDLVDLWKALVRQKQVIFLAVSATLMFAIAYLNLAERTYTVGLQVTPTESQGTKLGSGLSGLASIAGVSLSAGKESPSFDLYLEGLHSLEAARVLAENQALMQNIFSDEWDKERKDWREPGGIVKKIISGVKILLGMRAYGWQAPDAKRLQEFIADEVKISKDSNRPVVTITFQHKSSEIGISLISSLHKAVDDDLRMRTLRRSTGYISYLYDQLKEASVAEYREALVELIAEQEKRRMIASSNLSYAAEPFSGPYASLYPTKPQSIFVLITSILLGLVVGVIGAVVRDNFARNKQ